MFLSVRGNLFDHRLIPPPATRLIGHSRSSRISALHAGTEVSWWLQDGQSGSFTVSPGAPVDFATETGLIVLGGYQPDGFAILRASGPISAFSGADGTGGDATPFVPVEMLGQLVPIPFESEGGHPSGTSSIAVASPYEGSARIFDATGTLSATLSLVRGAVSPATTLAEQSPPAAALHVPPSGVSVGPGGWIEADVPIFVVQNPYGAANAFAVSSDEIFLPAVTPEDIRAELRRDGAGLMRRRMLDASGVETWVVC